jgi:hypothetical protein
MAFWRANVMTGLVVGLLVWDKDYLAAPQKK